MSEQRNEQQPAVVDQPEDDAPRAVDAPVTAVTVMEDRAQVTRTARVELDAGRHRLQVERVTPLAVDRTLRASLGDGVSARLIDVGMRRESTVSTSRPELQQSLREQREALDVELGTLEQRQAMTAAEASSLQTSRAQLLEVVAREAGAGSVRQEAWKASLRLLDERLEETEKIRSELDDAHEDLQQRIDRLEQRRWAANLPTVAYFGILRAEVELEQAGQIEVRWEYLVPCAIWRPSHRAELVAPQSRDDADQRDEDAGGGGDGAPETAASRLRWVIGGAVWQNTGEGWDEVQLRLSTERPALGAEVPLIDEDLLRLRPRTEQEKRTVEVSSRDEEIEVIAPGADDRRRATSALPGVDDGGEARVFELPHRVTIPPDGRAHVVELGAFEAGVELDLVCVPEVDTAVLLRSQQTNGASHPLLAGPVQLLRNGGFAGRTQVGFVAAGERFALGWGSLDELQVARRTGEHSEESVLTRRQLRKLWTELYFSNTGRSARRIRVTERIPVSEVEQVKVSLDDKETTSGYTRDETGHLHWTLELPPGSQREIKLRYLVDAHRSVVWR